MPASSQVRSIRWKMAGIVLAVVIVATGLVQTGGASAADDATAATEATTEVTAEFCWERHSSPAGDFVTHPVDSNGDGVADVCVLDNYFGSEPGVGSALKRLREARRGEYDLLLGGVDGRPDSGSGFDPSPVPDVPPGGLSEAFCQRWHSSPAGDFVTHPADSNGDGVADVCVLDNYFGSEPGVGSALKQLQVIYPHLYRCFLTLVRTKQSGNCEHAGTDTGVKTSIAAAMALAAEFQRPAALSTGSVPAERWEAWAKGYALFDTDNLQLLDAAIDLVILEAVQRQIWQDAPSGIGYSSEPFYEMRSEIRETLLGSLGVAHLYANELAWWDYEGDFTWPGLDANRAAQDALAAVGYTFYFQTDQLLADYQDRIGFIGARNLNDLLTERTIVGLGGNADNIVAVAAYAASNYVVDNYIGFDGVKRDLDRSYETLLDVFVNRYSRFEDSELTAEEELISAEADAAVAEAFSEAGIELFDEDRTEAFDQADISKLDAAIIAARVKMLHSLDTDVVHAALTNQMKSKAADHQAWAEALQDWAEARIALAEALDAFADTLLFSVSGS